MYGRKHSLHGEYKQCGVKSLAMTKSKHNVTIKGTKDGLVFYLDATCSLDDLLAELKEKVENSHQQILTGPVISVTVHAGMRYLSPEQETQVIDILRQRGNLVIKSVQSDVITKEQALQDKLASRVHIHTKTVRSGQIIRHEGDLLLLGDVNPGGLLLCTGNVFVLGSLRGMAHAGCEGNRECIIAARRMIPTQLRIAGVTSLPSNEWGDVETSMEFAFLLDGRMAIESISRLHKVRPALGQLSLMK